MIRRGSSLILHIIAGYGLGDLLVWLILIPIAPVKHLSDHLAGGVASFGELLGVVVGLLK